MWIKISKATGQLKCGNVYDLPSKLGRDIISAQHGGLVPKNSPGVELTPLPTVAKRKAKSAS